MTTDRSFLTRALCLVAAATLLVSGEALAATRGGAVPIPTGLSPVRYPDSAYEPQANVFLAVTGAGAIKGAWVSAAGALIGGSWVVSSSAAYQQTPAAQCGENGVCLVVWNETVGNYAQPMARLVSYSGGFVSATFALGPAGSYWEMTAGIAYSPATHEFLVTWMGDYPGADNVWAARVNLSGQLLASLALTTGSAYERGPSVAYNPVSGEYIIAYEGMTGNVAYTAVQRFANGVKVGNPITLDNASAEYISNAEYDSETQSVLVTWSRGTQSILGRAIAANGTPGGLLILSSSYGAYDALDMAFNPISKSFLIVTHGSLEDVGIEVSSAYGAAPAFTLTANGGSGNFNPRISTSTVSPLWFAVTSTSFTTLNGQFATSTPNVGAGGVPPVGDPPPPPPPPPPPTPPPPPPPSPTGHAGRVRQGMTDFDGDGKSDPAVFRPSNGNGFSFVRLSKTGATAGVQWGTSTDRPVPGDYDGDGKTDYAVYRPSTGTWYIKFSSNGTGGQVQWGGDPSDIPVPGDYDGDGKTDFAVYRKSQGNWYVKLSSTGAVAGINWGNGSDDRPLVGDYDGDGKADYAVYRPSSGMWFIKFSSNGGGGQVQWGGDPSDLPVVADFDGDGKSDIVVYRRSQGNWYCILSSSGAVAGINWGNGTDDWPVAADYDGDGKTDYAVYRPSTGMWYIKYSSNGMGTMVQWGGDPSDIAFTK